MDAENKLNKKHLEFFEKVGGCVVCGAPPILALSILMSDGVHSLPVCIAHLGKASEALEALIQATISGELPVQEYKLKG